MKAIRNLKVILVVLIVILISVISFGGIYYVNKGEMKNRLPDYVLGSSIKGYRHITLVASESTNEDENNTNSTSNTTENATANTTENETSNTTENATENNTTENAVNTTNTTSENVNTASNYRKSANIIKRRLKVLNIDNYNVTCDESTGRIVVDLPEDDKTDIILSDLTEVGKFTIEDSETGEVLLDNGDVKSVKFGQQNTGTSSSSSLIMGIEFNSKGTKKFRNITKEYQNELAENSTNDVNTANTSADSNSTDENLVGSENSTNETSSSENSTEESNTTNSTNTTENSTDSSEKKDKKVKIKIDDAEILTTDFSEVIDNGVLTLTVGNANDETQRNSALNIGAIIQNEPLPVKYQVEGNTYTESSIDENTLKVIIYCLVVIALVIALVLIVKYRTTGILQAILSVGYIGLLLIVIRYANVVESLDGILSIFVCYVINSVFAFMISKVLGNKDLTKKESKKSVNNVIKTYGLIIIPELIIATVCLFTSWSAIFSFGMILFWGIVISFVYNVAVTKFIEK